MNNTDTIPVEEAVRRLCVWQSTESDKAVRAAFEHAFGRPLDLNGRDFLHLGRETGYQCETHYFKGVPFVRIEVEWPASKDGFDFSDPSTVHGPRLVVKRLKADAIHIPF